MSAQPIGIAAWPPDLTGGGRDALGRLGHATWWVVPGRDRTRTRVVTTLLHGNEPSGFRAIAAWSASGVVPAVDVAFYVGSVETALEPPTWSHRALPGARDANRCFVEPFEGTEGERARQLLDLIRAARPEAVVDLHNNSGHSPAYGVGLHATADHLGLTSLFADRYMHSDLRLGTLVEGIEPFAMGVVIECGRAGDPVADATALAGLERFVMLEDLAEARSRAGGMEVLDRPVRVALVPEAIIAFGREPVGGAGVTLCSDIDTHNFRPLPAGRVVGWLAEEAFWPFDARDHAGLERSRELFEIDGRKIRTRREMVPVMMTTSTAIAKSDCLFYALERAGVPGAR
jgi:hypothetical protein